MSAEAAVVVAVPVELRRGRAAEAATRSRVEARPGCARRPAWRGRRCRRGTRRVGAVLDRRCRTAGASIVGSRAGRVLGDVASRQAGLAPPRPMASRVSCSSMRLVPVLGVQADRRAAEERHDLDRRRRSSALISTIGLDVVRRGCARRTPARIGSFSSRIVSTSAVASSTARGPAPGRPMFDARRCRGRRAGGRSRSLSSMRRIGDRRALDAVAQGLVEELDACRSAPALAALDGSSRR